MADVQVTFGGDISGFEGTTEEAVGLLDELGVAVKELGAEFSAMATQSTEALAKTAEGIKGAAEAVRSFREMLSGIGEAILAAFAVEAVIDFAKQMGETAEQIAHASETFGLTTSQVQRLKAEAAGAGVPFEALTTGIMRSDRALTQAREGSKQAEEAFKTLAINIHEPIDNFTLLQREIEGLAGIEDVPTRIGLAMQLFGRNVQSIAPLIGLTKEQLADLNTEMDTFGIKNDDAESKGLALAEAFNTNKIAMQGLGNVLTSALAPSFTAAVQAINGLIASMVQSYEHGGLVKQIFDAIGVTLNVLGSIISEIAQVFVAEWSAIDGKVAGSKVGFDIFKGVIIGIGDAVVIVGSIIQAQFAIVSAGVDNLIQLFKTLGVIIWDALTGQWSKIGPELQKGLDDVVRRVQRAGQDIERIASQASDAMAHMGESGTHGAPLPQAGSAGAQPPNLDLSKQKSDVVQQWQEQLQAMEVVSQNYFADEREAELAFWQSKLDLTTKGSKDWLAVQTKIYELSKSLAHETYDDHLAVLDAQIAADKDHWAQEQADWQAKLAYVARYYGEESKQYQQAFRAYEEAERAHQKELQRIAVEGAQERLQSAKIALQSDLEQEKAHAQQAEALIQEKAKMGPIAEIQAAQELSAVHAQEYADELATLDKEHALEQQALALKLASLDKETAAYKKALDDQLIAEQQFQAKRQQLIDQGTLRSIQDYQKMQQSWASAITPMVNAFGSGIQGMIQGTETLRQALVRVGEAILTQIITAMEQWIVKTAVQAITGQAAAKAGAESGVLAQAAQAGAAGVASMAAAPFPMDLTAPAFGAAMAADALSYLGVASAAGGWDEVPSAGAMTMLHPEEMVLSARYANPLRDMLTGLSGAKGGGMTGPVSAGDTHNHNWNVQAMDGASFMRTLRNNASQFNKFVGEQIRGGAHVASPAIRGA
jgi:hypothetical protein